MRFSTTYYSLICACFISFSAYAQSNADSLLIPSQYGTKVGLGISAFDGLGVPMRIYMTQNIIADAGLKFAFFSTWEKYDLPARFGGQINAGLSFMGNRFEKVKKNKIRSHGVALRYRRFLNEKYPANGFSVGWAMESFRKGKANQSFIFELGPILNFHKFEVNNVQPETLGGLYFRCHWNFFLKPNPKAP